MRLSNLGRTHCPDSYSACLTASAQLMTCAPNRRKSPLIQRFHHFVADLWSSPPSCPCPSVRWSRPRPDPSRRNPARLIPGSPQPEVSSIYQVRQTKGKLSFLRMVNVVGSTESWHLSVLWPSQSLELAGAAGFEPAVMGPKPTALPLGYAPIVLTENARRNLAPERNAFKLGTQCPQRIFRNFRVQGQLQPPMPGAITAASQSECSSAW